MNTYLPWISADILRVRRPYLTHSPIPGTKLDPKHHIPHRSTMEWTTKYMVVECGLDKIHTRKNTAYIIPRTHERVLRSRRCPF